MADRSDTGGNAATSDDLLHPRTVRRRLALAKDYLGHLELARRTKLRLDGDTTSIGDELVRATNAVAKLSGMAGERIQPRRRVPVVRRTEDSAPRPE